MKEQMLFYREYERFYAMAAQSRAFGAFCREAFGADFSQDGFSDLQQVKRLASHIPQRADLRLLDMGCGNGKMIAWLGKCLNASVAGVDYAEAAIAHAKELYPQGDWRVDTLEEAEYPQGSFDAVISMDTLYFVPDVQALTARVKQWLKPGGMFLIAYQEGDLVPRTENIHTTAAARALQACGMPYKAEDVTLQTRDMLLRKRESAMRRREAFAAEGNGEWYEMLLGQTEGALLPEEEYLRCNARYLYAARKEDEA